MMTTIDFALWALAGLIGGALAYRIAFRLVEVEAGAFMRCGACGAPEPFWRWLALPALLVRARCPACGALADIRQAAAEVVTAVLVVVLRARLGDSVATLIAAGATWVLVAASIADLRRRLIPNALTYPATALALIASVLPGGTGPLAALGGGVVGGGLALAMLFLGLFLYRRADVFGMGDVKLAIFIGVVTGFPRALSAFVYGVFMGGVVGLLLLLIGRSSRTTMAYGPALAIGAYLALLSPT